MQEPGGLIAESTTRPRIICYARLPTYNFRQTYPFYKKETTFPIFGEAGDTQGMIELLIGESPTEIEPTLYRFTNKHPPKDSQIKLKPISSQVKEKTKDYL